MRYSETKLSEGRTRRSPSERTATALAGEQGEARRGRRRDAGQWGLWSISVFGRHCFGFGRCGSIKKATFPHADTSESQRAEAANACLKICLTNVVKEVGWCFCARRCAGLISTRPLLFTGSDTMGNQSAALLSTLAHISTNTGAVFSPKPARGWNAIELYHSAGKANLHKPSCRVYQRESRPRKADCTPFFSLEETRPDSHLIGICLSQPGEQAVPTGVSHTN